MSQKTNEELKEYLGRVMALRSKQQESLSPQDVKSIALEIGLDEEDLARAEAEAAAQLARGQGYFRHQRFDDAIRELSDAVALSPTRYDAVHALALAYTERWKSSQREADREEAKNLSRRCLELNPGHEPSFTLLNVLDGKHLAPPPAPYGSVYFPPKTPKRVGRPKNASAILGGLAVLVVFGVVGLVTLASKPGQRVEPELLRMITTAEPGLAYTGSTAEATPAPGDFDIPAKLLPSENAPGLKLTVRGSRVNNYKDVSYYKLKAELTNEGSTEITELKMKVELLNEQGTVIATNINYTLGTHQAPIRPGDVHAFNLIEKTTPDIREVRLSVQTVTQEPAPASYPAAKPVDLTWGFEQPGSFSLSIRERDNRYNYYSGDDAYYKLNMEVENTGQAAIQILVLQLAFLDKEGKITSTREPYVVTSDSPSLLPGKIRALGGTYKVTKDFGGYRVTVIRAE